MAEWFDKPQVIVRVATLDDNPGVTPVAHIWTSHDVEWLQTDGLPKHAEWAT